MKKYKPLILKEDKTQLYKIICVGDIYLDDGFLKSSAKLFKSIKKYLSSADIVFGNLRSNVLKKRQVGDNPKQVDNQWADKLKKLNFNFLNVLNSDSFEFGLESFMSNIVNLQKKHIATIGEPEDPKEIKGIKIGKTNLKLGFTSYIIDEKLTGIRDIYRDIKVINTKTDILILALQFPEEDKISEQWEDLCKKFIDMGVKIIVVYNKYKNQNVEKYNDGFIAYSLGNFIISPKVDSSLKEGYVFEIDIDSNKEIVNVLFRKLTINNEYQPELVGEQ